MTFQFLGCQRSWVFLLYCSFFFMLGIKWCTSYLVTYHCGVKAIICVFSKLLMILKIILKALIFVLLHQTSCYPAWTLRSILYLHGHCCTVLMHNFNAVDNSQIANAKFAKISSTSHASFTSVPDGVGLTTVIIVVLLFDYCWIICIILWHAAVNWQ